MRHANYTAVQEKGFKVRCMQDKLEEEEPKTSNHSVPVRTAGEKSITQARNCNNNWHLYSTRYPGVPKHLTDITSWTDLQAGDLPPCRTSIPTLKRMKSCGLCGNLRPLLHFRGECPDTLTFHISYNLAQKFPPPWTRHLTFRGGKCLFCMAG